MKKDQADQEKLISTETKLERLTETANNMMHKMGIKDEAGTTYSNEPTPFPQEKQTQSLQDISNKKGMYDEKDYQQDDEEDYQEGTSYLPTPCDSLIREHYKQTEKEKSEQYFGKTISHQGNTNSEMEDESKHIRPLPLCYDSFHILRREWHPDNPLGMTHEPQFDYLRD